MTYRSKNRKRLAFAVGIGYACFKQNGRTDRGGLTYAYVGLAADDEAAQAWVDKPEDDLINPRQPATWPSSA